MERYMQEVIILTQLDKMDFATLTEEELKILQQAEDQINSTRDSGPVYLMALVQ
jgi:hypothetical protein